MIVRAEMIANAAVLGATSVLSMLAQIDPTKLGDVGPYAQLGSVGALIWLLLRTLPAAFTLISEDRKADREDRKADREAFRVEMAEMRKSFACQADRLTRND